MTMTGIALILIAFLATVSITLPLISRDRYRTHLRAAQSWARQRGLEFSTGAAHVNWTYELPRQANRGTRFQINGSTGRFPFTLAYVKHSYGDSETGGTIEYTLVVLHLRNAYPAAELERRRIGRRGRTGHPEFDRKFVISTDVPGGPGAVVSATLAEAMLSNELPLWSVRERELLCFVEGRQKVDEFDLALRQAFRVAELLNVR